VIEISADHIEKDRFQHESVLIRWRDDKEPIAYTMDQITHQSVSTGGAFVGHAIVMATPAGHVCGQQCRNMLVGPDE
jgi:hypothetical protein